MSGGVDFIAGYVILEFSFSGSCDICLNLTLHHSDKISVARIAKKRNRKP